MSKKFLNFIFVLVVILALPVFSFAYTLKAGVSMADRVPDEFFGTWRVTSTRVFATNEQIFKKNTTDLWNLSRSGNVITLENPFTGARASIVLSEVSESVIKFKKVGDYDGKILTDDVQLELQGKNAEIFSGKNYLILESLSNVDNSVIKVDRATYELRGEKISGTSIR